MDITVEEAIIKLNKGEAIGVPTDTVYGISTLCEHGNVLYDIKKRDKSKKLITMISSVDQINVDDEVLLKKMEEVWPGKVTLIFNYEGEMRSFRIPNEPNLLELLSKINKPIYTTSANVSGNEPVNTREEFKKEFPKLALLKEEVDSQRSNIPSEIYIYENKKFERIR